MAETSAVTILPQLAAAAAGPMQAEGTELKVYVAVAVAEGSAGLDHINVSLSIRKTTGELPKILRPDDFANGVYEDWISMSIYEPAGTYILDKVILQAENGAYVRYCGRRSWMRTTGYLALPVTAAFQINNGVTVLDETAPVLGAVVVSPMQRQKSRRSQ